MSKVIEVVTFIVLIIGLPILATLLVDYMVDFVTMETIVKSLIGFTVLYGIYTIKV